MSEDQITALAREYAEEMIKGRPSEELPNCLKNSMLAMNTEHVAEIFQWLLRRYCLVEKWIDPKNKLPEIRERVLICEKAAYQHIIFIGKRVPSPCTDGWEWNQSTKESVVAWMPLPKYTTEIAKEVEG